MGFNSGLKGLTDEESWSGL